MRRRDGTAHRSWKRPFDDPILRSCGACPACAEHTVVGCRQNCRTVACWLAELQLRGPSMAIDDYKGLDVEPDCLKCGSKMRFSCTEPEPDQSGFVHHIYECSKCRTTQSFVTPAS
jgi:hypothetical protein